MKVREKFILISIIVVVLIVGIAVFWQSILWSLIIIMPLIIIGIYDILQTKHTIRKNFPLIGNLRYLLEKIRPEIMQYFVETDTEGTPINRQFRSLIYQRAKGSNDTMAFGTQADVYRAGYEWMNHSLYPIDHKEMVASPRVTVGGPDCKKPYNASLLNISAMSFGSLSKNAILALNKGAADGNFAHNTGEGGISPYHLEAGGDLIWQIGTGYFGCRTKEGDFCVDTFIKKATLDNVKMIEIKLSQGAKPGHGGILPASKNTEEIAKIRDVQAHTDVNSPPGHTAFSSPSELLDFVKLLRDNSGGKPIGFKLCIGDTQDFIDICKEMISKSIKPDFITIDGGEGGTGAAPVEFSNSLGTPLRDGLSFAYDTLKEFGLKGEIKLIASGKIFTGFHIARVVAIGADMVNSARAMMLAIGCIQARECNTNTCPVGVATQNKSLMKGLNVPDKAKRVASYHKLSLNSFSELLAASGIKKPTDLKRKHINKRINLDTVKRYDEIYPYNTKE